ncbi:hypothetical protein M885DRAFT_541211 [Pelagophyceae sp. CCMP2097]|nr:hypothetical protein M885DRAFT_541211 [Pelagophyceae sp. CCMP2097]
MGRSAAALAALLLLLRVSGGRGKPAPGAPAAPAAAARVALVGVWYSPFGAPLPDIASHTCLSMAEGYDAGVTLVIFVDDAAAVPAACTAPGRRVEIVGLGADGVANALGRGLATALRLGSSAAEDVVVARVRAALRRLPTYVVELKPAWLWALRPYLVAANFTHATYTDFDAIYGELDPWLKASALDRHDVVVWTYEDDVRRVFARGQFTLVALGGAGAEALALRFVRCPYLSVRLMQRLASVATTPKAAAASTTAAARAAGVARRRRPRPASGAAAGGAGGAGGASQRGGARVLRSHDAEDEAFAYSGAARLLRSHHPAEDEPFAYGGACPTHDAGSQLVTAEACYSCALMTGEQDGEYAAFVADWTRLRETLLTAVGSAKAAGGGYSAQEFAVIARPLAVTVVPAMFSDHVLDRVWWWDGLLLRCDARVVGESAKCAIAMQHFAVADAARRRAAAAAAAAPKKLTAVQIQRPCANDDVGFGWLRRSCPRGTACVATTGKAGTPSRSALEIRRDGSALTVSGHLPPHDLKVSVAAIFHYRVWADNRAANEAADAFAVAPAGDAGRHWALGVDGFLASRNASSMDALALAPRERFDGPTTACFHYGEAAGLRAFPAALPSDPPAVVLQFFGPPRSGSSFLTALLDGHANMVVANEFDGVAHYRAAPRTVPKSGRVAAYNGAAGKPTQAEHATLAQFVCNVLRKTELSVTQWNSDDWVRSHPNLTVPGTAQGGWRGPLRVVGAKKVGRNSRFVAAGKSGANGGYHADPMGVGDAWVAATLNLRAFTSAMRNDAPYVLFKWIVIVRSPWDQVATCALRRVASQRDWNWYTNKAKVNAGAPWAVPDDSMARCVSDSLYLGSDNDRWAHFLAGGQTTSWTPLPALPRASPGVPPAEPEILRGGKVVGESLELHYDAFVADRSGDELRALLAWIDVDAPEAYVAAALAASRPSSHTATKVRWTERALVRLDAMLAALPKSFGRYARERPKETATPPPRAAAAAGASVRSRSPPTTRDAKPARPQQKLLRAQPKSSRAPAPPPRVGRVAEAKLRRAAVARGARRAAAGSAGAARRRLGLGHWSKDEAAKNAASHPAFGGPVAYLKLHKVGSSTVAASLMETYIVPLGLKLCEARVASVATLAASKCQAIIEHDKHMGLIYEQFGRQAYERILGPRVVTCTVLRLPHERLLSRFFYKRRPDVASQGRTAAQVVEAGLSSWLRGHDAQCEAQHYLLALARMRMQPCGDFDDACAVDAVLAARAALAEFDVVGVSERMDDFGAALAAKLGLPAWRFSSQKITPQLAAARTAAAAPAADPGAPTGPPARLPNFPPFLQARILMITRHDRIIYDAALRRAVAPGADAPKARRR